MELRMIYFTFLAWLLKNTAFAIKSEKNSGWTKYIFAAKSSKIDLLFFLMQTFDLKSGFKSWSHCDLVWKPTQKLQPYRQWNLTEPSKVTTLAGYSQKLMYSIGLWNWNLNGQIFYTRLEKRKQMDFREKIFEFREKIYEFSGKFLSLGWLIGSWQSKIVKLHKFPDFRNIKTIIKKTLLLEKIARV